MSEGPSKSEYPFVFVNEDGSVREVTVQEKLYLQTEYSGGDGGRPYIKTRYTDKDGNGRMGGFCFRNAIPENIRIGRTMEETSDAVIASEINRIQTSGYRIDLAGIRTGGKSDKLPKPSLLKIVKLDYLSFLSVTVLTVTWLLVSLLHFLGVLPHIRFFWRQPFQSAAHLSLFVKIAGAASFIFVPLLVYRINMLFNLFKRGVRIDGRITHVFFIRDRGRIEYEYRFEGRAFHNGIAVMRSQETEDLREGERVHLLVDKGSPGRSIILDLMTDDAA